MKYRIYTREKDSSPFSEYTHVKTIISKDIEQATRTARKQYGQGTYVVEDEPTESVIVDVGEESE